MVISNLRPQPVELAPGSNKWLFQPVYYIWADFNRTKDGSWPDGDAPKSIQYWYVNDASVQSKSWSPDDPVAEGWYSLNVSVWRSMDLLALQSPLQQGKHDCSLSQPVAIAIPV
jgi:hypothetical protein